MFLLDIPEGSKIMGECSDTGTFIIFHHLDGMYSYCTTEKGGVVHLSAYTPIEKDGENYIIGVQKQ